MAENVPRSSNGSGFLLQQLAAVLRQPRISVINLFLICLLVLLLTMVPTLYTLDSAELVSASATLGFVHAPGYPLYLLSAHLFTLLPIRDVFFRVTLFSAVCLAGAAVVVDALLVELLHDRLIALGAALTLVWSYYVWLAGLFPEIYAPQLLTIALCACQLARLRRRAQPTKAFALLGVLIGMALALAPQSILLAAGLPVALYRLRLSWRRWGIVLACAGAVLLAALLYFPIRFAAAPSFNTLGVYDRDGIFQPVPLNTVDGILQTLRGTEFQGMFFAAGYLPSAGQVAATFGWLWGNSLGLGLIVALVGLVALARRERGVLFVWLAACLPYAYFYTTYGADDRSTMLVPLHFLIALAFAYGLRWLLQGVSRWRTLYVLALPALMLVINFPLLNLSQETGVRDAGEALLADLPPNADVFGDWYEVFPLQYLQTVEGWRPDVRLYPTFAFHAALLPFVNAHADPAKPYHDRPVVFLNGAVASSRLDTTAVALRALPGNTRSAAPGAPISGGFVVVPPVRLRPADAP